MTTPIFRRSFARLCVSLFLLLDMAIHSVSFAEPPPSDSDSVFFAYRKPVAEVGSGLAVYAGIKTDDFVKTTPFRPTRFSLSPDNKSITIYVSTKLTLDDEKALEQILNKSSSSTVKSTGLSTVFPYEYTLELFDPTGKTLIGTHTEQNESKDGKKQPIIIDVDKGLSFTIPLTPPVLPSHIGKYRTTFTANYLVKTGQIQSATFETVSIGTLSALEKVLGADPGKGPIAGDLISRDAISQVKSNTMLSRIVRFYNANEKDSEKIMEALNASLAKEINIEVGNFKLNQKYTIWTPEFGRLEIGPTQFDKLTNETKTKQEVVSRQKKRLTYLREEAKKSKDFDSWYTEQVRKRSGEGAGSASFEADASVIDVLSGSGSGDGSFSFKNTVDNKDVDQGQKEKFRETYNLLKSDQNLESEYTTKFEEYWKGADRIFGLKEKAYNLYAMRDIASIAQETVAIFRQTMDVSLKELQVKTPQQELAGNLDGDVDILSYMRLKDEALLGKIANGSGRRDSVFRITPDKKVELYFRGESEFTNADLAELRALKMPIRKIECNGMRRITDNEMASFIESLGAELEDIYLNDCCGPLSAEAALSVSRERVSLFNMDLGSRGLKKADGAVIRNFGIGSLRTSDGPFGDEKVASFIKSIADKLETVNVFGEGVGRASIHELAECPKLTRMGLAHCEVNRNFPWLALPDAADAKFVKLNQLTFFPDSSVMRSPRSFADFREQLFDVCSPRMPMLKKEGIVLLGQP